jgi:uncharacterized protein YdgA (DUF945 family)
MSLGKNLLVGAAVATTVAAAAVFAIAPMYTGGKIEQDFRANIAESTANTPSGVKASVESYQRGWRSATAVTHWQIPELKIDFRLQHTIDHGPNPQFAVARIETVPVIEPAHQAAVQRLFKGSPLTATTLIGSSGSATTTIVSPSFTSTTTDDPNVQVAWGGLNAVLTQQGDLFTLRGDIPSLTANNIAKNEQMSVTALHLEGDTRMTGSGIPLIGSGAVSLGAMDISTAETGNVKVGATRMSSSQNERGDVLDMQFAFTNDGISSSGGTKPPFRLVKCELEYKLSNLDKAAYQKYQEEISKLFAGPGDAQALAAEALPKTMALANDLLRAVAARSPTMEIPKFHVALEQGAVDGRLTATFNGTGLQTWPPAMDDALKRTTVNATLRAPESLLRMAAETKARDSAVQMLAMQNAEATEENIRAASTTIVEQQMQMLATMPYLKREGSDYTSTLTLQNGEVKVNGQLLFGGAAGMGFGAPGATPPGGEMPPMPTDMIPPEAMLEQPPAAN